jgi:hypothetical protein
MKFSDLTEKKDVVDYGHTDWFLCVRRNDNPYAEGDPRRDWWFEGWDTEENLLSEHYAEMTHDEL